MDARSQNRVFKKPLYTKNPKNLYIKAFMYLGIINDAKFSFQKCIIY